MKLIFNLANIYFKETISGLFATGKKKNNTNMLLAIGILALVLLFSTGFVFYFLADSLSKYGFIQNIILLALILSLIMTLILTLADGQGHFYKTTDYELLYSMPIKLSYIITAKCLSAYLINFLYSTLILLPAFIVYFIYTGVSFSIFYALIGLIFIPAFSQLISCIISWFLSIITYKMNNKNIFRTIFTTITILLISVFYYLASSKDFSYIFAIEMPLWFNIVFSHIYFFLLAITEGSFLYFLISLGLSLIYLSLSVLIITVGYKKINSSFISKKRKKGKRTISVKKSSLYRNLLKKEFYTIINSPTYFVNSIMGPLMSIFVTIICIVVFSSNISGIPLSLNLYIVIGIFVFGLPLCTGISPSTSSSISIEGTRFQILKSLPIKYSSIVTSKVSVNLILCLPVVLVTSVIFCSIINIGLINSVIITLYLMITIIAQTFFGFLINVRLPKLNWTNEVQATKQGLALVVSMIVDTLLSVLPMLLYFFIPGIIDNVSLYLFIVLIFEIIFTTSIIYLTFTKGKKLFNKIQ